MFYLLLCELYDLSLGDEDEGVIMCVCVSKGAEDPLTTGEYKCDGDEGE